MKKLVLLFLISICVLQLNAQWKATNGADVNTSIWCFTTNGNNILAGGEKGIYVSTNGGNCFTFSKNGLSCVYTNSVAIIGNTFFAGVGDGFSGPGGVCISTDFGITWSITNNGIPNNTVVEDLLVDGTDIYAATEKGIYKSTNSGSTWTLFGLGGISVWSLAKSGSTFVAGCASNIYLSTNSGVNWSEIKKGLPSDLQSNIVKKVIISGSKIFISLLSGGVYMTADNGSTWVSKNSGLSISSYNYIEGLIINNNILYIATNGNYVYKSTNDGSTWSQIKNGLPSMYCSGLGYSGSTIFVGSGGNDIYKTTNGGSNWSIINNQIGEDGIFIANGRNLIASSVVSTDEGGCWFATSGLSNANCFYYISTSLYAGSNGFYKSTNNGISWVKVNKDLPTSGGLPVSIVVNGIINNGNTILIGTSNGIYKSTNSGSTWSLSNTGIPVGTYARSLGINGSNIFACTNSGMYLTTNNGSSWSSVNTGLTDLNINTILVNSSNIFVGTQDSGVFKSSNNGALWSPINSGLTNKKINAITNSNNNLFVGTNGGGVFMSSNNGLSWYAINTGLPSNYIETLAVNDTYIFANFSNSNGVYKRSLLEVLIPDKAVTPTGDTFLCLDSPNSIYTTTGANNATSYVWTISPTSAGTISGTGLSSTVNWDAAYSGIAQISVKGVNSFGEGSVSSSLKVTLNKVFNISNNTGICFGDSILLNAQYQKESGVYIDSLVTITGCDSIISTSLTVHNPYYNSITKSICDGDSIFLQNNYRKIAGTYHDSLKSFIGCDSIIETVLTVNSLPQVPTISANGSELSSSSPNGNQWFINGNKITGATNQIYNSSQNGNYTVSVSIDGCSSISSIHTISNCGINDVTIESPFTIRPNPVQGRLYIDYKNLQSGKIQILNLTGKLIFESEIHKTNIDLTNQPSGTYIFKLQSEDKIYIQKFTLE